MPISPASSDQEIQAYVQSLQSGAPNTEEVSGQDMSSGQPIAMVDPSGKVQHVLPHSIDTARLHGWREATDQDIKKEEAIQKDVDYQEGKGGISNADANIPEGIGDEGGKFGSTMKRFSNHLSLGASDLNEDLQLSPEKRAIHQEARDRWDAAHPILATVGKALGEIGNPLNYISEGTGGAIGKAVAREVTEQAGKEVAEQGIKDIGTHLAEQGVKAAAEKSLASKVASSAVKYAGMGALYAAPSSAVQLAYGDPNTAAETMLASAGLAGLLGGGGRLLGEATAGAAKEGSSLISKVAGAPARLEEHYAQLEKQLSDPAMRKMAPSFQQMAKDITQEITVKMPEVFTEEHADSLKFINQVTDKVAEGGTEPSIVKAVEIKKAIEKMGKKFKPESVEAKVSHLATGIIDSHINSGAQRMFTEGATPEQFADYLSTKQINAILDKITPKIEEFGKSAATNTLRGAAATVGAHIAGPPGAIAMEYMVNKFLKNDAFATAATYLKKAIKEPTSIPLVGGLLAKEGNTSLKAHLEQLPDILHSKNLVGNASSNVVQHLLGSTTGLSKDQQYSKLTGAINQASIDIGSTSQKVGAISAVFSAHPELAHLVAQKQFGALSYLQSQIPKNPNPPKAFQADTWKPSKQQQAEFLQKVAVVNDPTIVWKKYQEGTLSKIDRDTLKAVYPATYQEYVNKLISIAYDPRTKPLTNEQTQKLSMFTGIPFNSGIKNVAAIQQAVAVPPTPAPQSTKKQSNPRPSRAPKFEHAPSLLTETDRRTYGQKAR